MNWFYVGAVAVCIPLMAVYKEKYNKLDIDTQTKQSTLPDIVDPAV